MTKLKKIVILGSAKVEATFISAKKISEKLSTIFLNDENNFLKSSFMEREKFTTIFFRVIAILTPLLMLFKSMWDKRFTNVGIETILLVVYLILIVFYMGFITGSSSNEKLTKQERKRK